MLELKGIRFHPATSEKEILTGVNLRAHLGHPIIIEGSSGSGKTSLVEVISGLTTQQKGDIRWNHQYLTAKKRKQLCGVVFQFPERHFLGLTISQELRLGHKRITTQEQLNVLNKVGLSEINLKQPPETLSGGQQRRLAIAVQLLKKPRVLLLDEPTAGLDWSVRKDILDLMEYLSKDQLLIVVTHEAGLFKQITFSSYLLKNGKIKKQLPLRSINKKI
mgnify:CR=1 FL=1